MQKMIKKYFALFALPTLLAFIVAFVVPFVLGIYLSFTEFTTVTDAKWIGLSNYVKAFQDQDFVNALWFTAKFTIVSVISINVLAFLLALLLTQKVLGRNVFRTVFFMPNLIGGIVLGYIWQLMINGVLYQFEVTLTSSAKYGFWGLVILMNWQLIGYMMVIYIAGIQNVPKEQLEAAKIDGASNGIILRKIILPLVMPSITICLFLTISNSFKLFDQNLALTAGAPSKQTAMLALDIFNTFYSKAGFEGGGQAKAVMFFVMVALIVVVQLGITRRREIES
ncbi:ABC transporter permease [Paenibacillus montaniterrae]|uniref:ABC transporter permease n=1 Tax=Paenibacillus montaniterrae TaxID=429341 RepID=A0A920CYD5_9BACL|nr:sugar ABC transporter permease [Paenibacillus montaniterrae]GIP16268.1 ABC transporter permease [Paenibacillus montaniterrae]